ncbi:hypothetical protein JXM67_14355 [candidate division WOR-3 bacterium]|nr:hypothetical protein [candidate division WOR-3 bacterium]
MNSPYLDYYGLIANAAVSLGIAIIGILVSIIVMRRQKSARTKSAGYIFASFWMALSLLYFFVAVRTLFGYLGYEQLDLVFFYVDNFFGGLMAPCALFLFFYFITQGKTKVALIPGLISLGIWATWNVVNIIGGAGNYTVTLWFTEWEPNSAIARAIAIFGLYLPSALAIIGLLFALIRAQSRLARYRIIFTSVSMFVAFGIVIIDYLFPGPPWMRLVILLAAILGYFTYVPPKFLHKTLEMEAEA